MLFLAIFGLYHPEIMALEERGLEGKSDEGYRHNSQGVRRLFRRHILSDIWFV